MPGDHDTQKFKLVGCWVDKEFLAEIDKARAEKPRSLFVREALAEKLEDYGVIIDREKIAAPDRAGKGGPQKKVHYGSHRPNSVMMNEPDPQAHKPVDRAASSLLRKATKPKS